MRLSAVAPSVLLLLAGCATSRPASEADPVAEARVLQAERDSLRAVADSQGEALVLLTDSVTRLRNTNDLLVGRRRPAGTPPGGTPPAARAAKPAPPAVPTPASRPAPTLRADPTAPDLPAEAFSDTLTADELFMPASATLAPLGLAILDRIGYEITRLPEAFRVRVEGHADSTPPGPSIKDRWPSNWELSSARAAAVIRYLVEQGLPATRFELVSYSDTRPVAGNDTPQARARNRRVVIVAR